MYLQSCQHNQLEIVGYPNACRNFAPQILRVSPYSVKQRFLWAAVSPAGCGNFVVAALEAGEGLVQSYTARAPCAGVVVAARSWSGNGRVACPDKIRTDGRQPRRRVYARTGCC